MSGTEIRSTSIGNSMILSPFKLNIKTMVNKSAYSDSGEILGMNFRLYHAKPFVFTKKYRLRKPARNGIPKYKKTLWLTSFAETLMLNFANPSFAGKTLMKKKTKKL